MNLYNQEELDRIQKIKETNDKLEDFFNDKRAEWNKNVEPLFKVLTTDLSNPSNFKDILEAQSISLSFKQAINENINYFLNKRSRETTKIKKLRQDKFIFYATSFGVKTNMGEKTILIDAHIAENDRCLELIILKRTLIMSIIISDELLTATRMNEGEMKQEIAVLLFQKDKLTLAQASRFAGMNRIAFQHLLASRQIPVHYGVEDFEQDIKNLREMGRL